MTSVTSVTFWFQCAVCLLRVMEVADTSHLDQVQHGYEKMDHFSANVERQRRALMSVDFLTREAFSSSG